MTDALFADVSEWQTPVTDAYPHQVLTIRSNDGAHQDRNFPANYQWCANAVDSGRLAFFIVYFYWRPDWQTCVLTMKQMVSQQGGPHPKMVAMIDCESGGNPSGDQSTALNDTFQALAQWLGDPLRVVGYGNRSDLDSMWPTKPQGMRIVAAGYGSNPDYPGQIAHQYTDGTVGADGLPTGAPPWASCDMNSADGLTAQDFAAACGVGEENTVTTPTDQQQLAEQVQYIYGQLGPWPQLGTDAQGDPLTLVDAVAAIKSALEAKA